MKHFSTDVSKTAGNDMVVPVIWITFTFGIALVLGDGQYEFKGKVALITGAAEGIGFGCAEELLKNGVKGVTIVDVNRKIAENAARRLNDAYGPGSAIFVFADISNRTQFEDAFKKSIDHWKQLDIVANIAGVVDDNNWRLTVNVNAVGTLQGNLLGFKYMSIHKGGKGGVILNISSLAGIIPASYLPTYTASKHFVVGLGRALGHDVYYEYNNVRVVTLCPSFTNTNMTEVFQSKLSHKLSPKVDQLASETLNDFSTQSVDNVSGACAKVIKDGSNGSVWIVENNLPAYEIIIPDRDCMRKTV